MVTDFLFFLIKLLIFLSWNFLRTLIGSQNLGLTVKTNVIILMLGSNVQNVFHEFGTASHKKKPTTITSIQLKSQDSRTNGTTSFAHLADYYSFLLLITNYFINDCCGSHKTYKSLRHETLASATCESREFIASTDKSANAGNLCQPH